MGRSGSGTRAGSVSSTMSGSFSRVISGSRAGSVARVISGSAARMISGFRAAVARAISGSTAGTARRRRFGLGHGCDLGRPHELRDVFGCLGPRGLGEARRDRPRVGGGTVRCFGDSPPALRFGVLGFRRGAHLAVELKLGAGCEARALAEHDRFPALAQPRTTGRAPRLVAVEQRQASWAAQHSHDPSPLLSTDKFYLRGTHRSIVRSWPKPTLAQ